MPTWYDKATSDTLLAAKAAASALTAEAARAQTAEALLAPLASPAFTGTPTIGGTPVAKTSDIAALVNSAPGTLDTLGELAAALTADEGTAATLATLVGTKAPLASPAFTGTPTIGGIAVAKISDISASSSGSGSAPNPTSTALAKFYGATAIRGSAPVITVIYGDSYIGFGDIATKINARFQQEWPVTGAPAVSNSLTTPRASRAAGVQVVDAAVSGQSSANMTDAGRSASIAALKPALYIIMIGANDANPSISITPAQHKTNILAEIAYQKANNPAPFAFVLVHAFQRQDSGVVPPLGPWSAYGQVEQDIAAADPGFVVAVDLVPAFASVGVPGSDPYTLLNVDKLHPSAAGGQLIADLIWDAIRPRLTLGANTSASPYLTLVNTAAPTLSGSTAVGATLTASTGSWSAAPDSYTYTWYQDGAQLYDSTSATRVTTSGDAGHQIAVSVAAVKAGWATTAAPSNAITVAGAAAATAPGAPTALTATPGNGQAALAWTAPASTGGAAITDYIVQSSTDGTTFTTFADGTSSATTATVTGLSNGTSYTFRVAAVNTAGTGAYSATATGTPTASVSVPGAPTGLTATAGDSSAALSWTAPASNGGAAISDYRVQYSTDGTTYTTFTHTASTTASATVTGLTNGTAYTFRVAATNSAGTGTNSATATATPASASVSDSGPALTKTGTVTSTTGKFGNAANTNGAGRYSPATAISGALTTATVEFWAKTSVADLRVAAGTTVGTTFYVGTTYDGKAQVQVGNAAITSATFINDNAWHHIAVVMTTSGSTFYVDGTVGGSGNAITSITFDTNFQIGAFTGAYNWPGAIDELRISNTARYTGAFTPATTAFTTDANTLALYHFETP